MKNTNFAYMRFRKLFIDTADECRRHVATHFLNGVGIATMVDQVLFEAVHCRSVFPVGGEQNVGLFKVNKQADIVVASTTGGFIHAHMLKRIIQTIPRHKNPSTTERHLRSIGLDPAVRKALEEGISRPAKVINLPVKRTSVGS